MYMYYLYALSSCPVGCHCGRRLYGKATLIPLGSVRINNAAWSNDTKGLDSSHPLLAGYFSYI